MANAGGTLRILTGGRTVTVNMTDEDGSFAVVTVGGSAVTFPTIISSDTTFVVTVDGNYTVSALIGGVETYGKVVRLTYGAVNETIAVSPTKDQADVALSTLSATFAPKRMATAADVFTAPTLVTPMLVGLGAGNVQYYIQNPNTFRRSPDRGVSLFGVTAPTGIINAFTTCYQVYEWQGYVYAIFQDADSAFKLYRAAITTGLTALTWSSALLTLTAGGTGFGYIITGTSTSLLVGEYGDPQLAAVKTAHIWRSTDGTTFTAVKTYGSTYRHVHCVAADPYNDGQVWASVGDNVDNCFSFSSDHGATWTDLPITMQWQATQLSFTPDWVYAAPDAVSQASLYLIDRATKTPRVGASTNHRALAVRDAGSYQTGSTTSTSTTFTDTLSAPFSGADKGRKIVGPGIPDGTTISAVASASSITLSIAATATASSTYYAIDRPERPWGACFIGAVDPTTGIYYGIANADATGSASQGRPILFAVLYPGGPCVHLADLAGGSRPSVQIGQGYVWSGTAYRKLISAPYAP